MFASKDLYFSKPSGYQISRSLRFRSSASAYLNRTNGTPTSTTTTTISFWVKRGTLGVQNNTLGSGQASGTNYSQILFNSADQLNIGESSGAGFSFITTQVFRDPSAWYHIVFVYDSTQATSTNRLKLYVNGVQVTSFSTTVYPALNQAYLYNTSAYIKAFGNIWYNGGPGSFPFDGYLTEINFIDGQALTPSSFGQTNTITGVWQPIKYTGTYGNNGFYLNFSDNSNNTATTIGKDYSGNGNNFTPTNISVTAGATYDSMLDVPTLYADGGNGRGNYATLNPTNNNYTNSTKVFTISDGNLTATTNTGGGGSRVMGTVSVSSGKWYSEFTVGPSSINSGADQGVICVPALYQTTSIGGGGSGGVVYIAGTGQKRTDASGYSAYGSTYTTGDVIGVALDMDAGTVTFYKNNVSQGVALSGLTGNYTVGAQANDAAGANYATYYANFGQRPFTYTPPSGYSALNTQNLPNPTISNGANYMAATTYTGTGSALTISNGTNNPAGISFKPDLVWGKVRNTTGNNLLFDSLRGTGTFLISNTTAADGTNAQTLTAFNSNGYSYGTDTTLNTNANTYVAWQWQAGAGTSSSNTSGSITSTVSVGATQGFSVVTYTGNGSTATVGHGLGVAPKMIIVKRRDSSVNGDWFTYTSMTGNTSTLYLNLTSAVATGQVAWNSTTPTSTVFSVGNTSGVNASASTYVAYCFSEVAGFSKFGSYSANGSADGPFIYLGFRPRFVLFKTTNAVDNWIIFDSSRDTYNVVGTLLYPNTTDTDQVSPPRVDFLSNGFKLRTVNTPNGSGWNYIYAAFAENPFKNSLAR